MRLSLVLAACFIVLTACSKSEPVAEKQLKSTSSEPVKEYALHGEVTRLDTKDKIATIKHQAIGDWMGAMTMDFPVKDDADFAKLSPGQPVNATVYVQGFNYWVGDVKAEPAPTPAPAK
jgi:Cu/Ag efflux protein CusF